MVHRIFPRYFPAELVHHVLPLPRLDTLPQTLRMYKIPLGWLKMF